MVCMFYYDQFNKAYYYGALKVNLILMPIITSSCFERPYHYYATLHMFKSYFGTTVFSCNAKRDRLALCARPYT